MHTLMLVLSLGLERGNVVVLDNDPLQFEYSDNVTKTTLKRAQEAHLSCFNNMKAEEEFELLKHL